MNKLDIYTDKNGQPQISYEATVRSLHFVPLGEKSDGEGQQSYQKNDSGVSQGGYQGGMASGYTNAPTAFKAAPQQPAHAFNGMSDDHGQNEEEPIPF
mgnify:FL=1